MILIDGHTFSEADDPDRDSDLSTGPDGCHAPFYLFDTGAQEHLSGPIPTREAAERLIPMLRPFAAFDHFDGDEA